MYAVRKVKETTDVDVVNALLKDGWLLLSVGSGKGGFHYVLALGNCKNIKASEETEGKRQRLEAEMKKINHQLEIQREKVSNLETDNRRIMGLLNIGQ